MEERRCVATRIYLDMCCYNRPYDDQSQLKVAMETEAKLYIQDLVREGKIDLVGSFILDFECSRNPFEMRKRTIFDFLASNMKEYVGSERSDVLKTKIVELMRAGIKEKDATHLASAIYAGCDYFISTDIRLLKHKTDEIRLVTPVAFVMELEGNDDGQYC